MALLPTSFAATHAALLRKVALAALHRASPSMHAASLGNTSPDPVSNERHVSDVSASCLRILCSLAPQGLFLPHIKALLLPEASENGNALRPPSDPLQPLYPLFCNNWSQVGPLQHTARPVEGHKGPGRDKTRHSVSANALHVYSAILADPSSPKWVANEAVLPYLLAAISCSGAAAVVAAALEAAGVLAGKLQEGSTAPGLPVLLKGLCERKDSIVGAPAGGALALIHTSLASGSHSSTNGSCAAVPYCNSNSSNSKPSAMSRPIDPLFCRPLL